MSQILGPQGDVPLSCSPGPLPVCMAHCCHFCGSSHLTLSSFRRGARLHLLLVLGPSSGPGVRQMVGLLLVFGFKTNVERC